jgi:hypothetical protein
MVNLLCEGGKLLPRSSHEPERGVGTFPYMRAGATALETMRQMVGCMLRSSLCVVGAKPLVEWAKKNHADDIEFYTNGHCSEKHGFTQDIPMVWVGIQLPVNSCFQLLMMSCKKKWP